MRINTMRSVRNTFAIMLVAIFCVVGIAHDAVSAYNPIPTGTGWRHITSGFEDPAARAINLASADITGLLATGNQAAQTMAGDVTGTTAASVVAKVNGATYPAAGALTTGTVPRVTGASTVAYGAVDLANVAAVTGVLAVGNQASQSLAGDATGTTATVVNTQARGLKSATTTVSVSAATAPTSGQSLIATASTTATWQKVDTTSASYVTVPGTTNGVVTSSGTFLQQAANVLAGSGFISTGTTPALTGTIRFSDADSIIFRNHAASSDIIALSKDVGDNILLGSTTDAAQGFIEALIPTGSLFRVRSQAGNNWILTANNTNVLVGMPIIGDQGQPSPYGVHGLVSVALPTTGSVITTLSSSQYPYNTIRFTGALTADQTAQLPDATDAAAYTKIINNTCTGAFNVIIRATTGALATVTVPNGATVKVLLDSRGVTFASSGSTSTGGLAVGATPSSAGDIRLPNSRTDAIAFRNSGNTADQVALSTDSTNLDIGQDNAGARQFTNTTVAAGTSVFINIGASSAATFNSTNSIIGNLSTTTTSTLQSITDVFLKSATFTVADASSVARVTVNGTQAAFALPISFGGANAAASGDIRLTNTSSIVSRNTAHTGDVKLFSIDSGDDIVIGDAVSTTQGHIFAKIPTSQFFRVIGQAAGNFILSASNTNVLMGMPVIGDVGQPSPYSVHGKTTVSTTGTFTLAAADYVFDAIQFTSPTAPVVTFPTVSADARAYYKTIIYSGNSTLTATNGLPGTPKNCSVPTGSTLRVLFDTAGCHPVGTSSTYP